VSRAPCKYCGDKRPAQYHECDYSRMRDELYCPHGVGHGPHVHGCDGCCSTPEWKAAWEKYGGRKPTRKEMHLEAQRARMRMAREARLAKRK